jgi:Zn-dependent M28 family amino/carboxypeptidase
MGSRVYARNAKKKQADILGMICLEMVGYTCRRKGCQHFPFPLMFLGYPDVGDFIGIVGNWRSRSLTNQLFQSFKKNPSLPVERVTVPLGGWTLPSVRLSDHASFWDQGYKAVMITDSAFFRNPHYHRASDTMDTLDVAFMAEVVESLLRFFSSKNH